MRRLYSRKKKPGKMITIRDVANKAQVSTATVSRVINETHFVDPATKERVHSAMRDLGYRPNLLARSLRRRSTRMIGLVVFDNSNPFYAEVARAIEHSGYAEGYSVILCNTDNLQERLAAHINGLLSRQVDGLILLYSPPPDILEQILAANVPLVVGNSEIDVPGVDEVAIDTEYGGYIAGKYLLRLGHRRIGCITGPDGKNKDSKRIRGFRRAMVEAGVRTDAKVFAYGDGRYESGRKAMHELLQRDLDLTAIFVYDDLMAIAAINVLQEAGLKVPDDISIISMDNILFASTIVPRITTIAQPMTELGNICMRLLLERIQNPNKEPSRLVLPTKLIERASCRAIET